MALFSVIQAGGGDATTIQAGIDLAVTPGDIVEIQDSATYSEELVMDTGVTLRSQAGQTPTINTAVGTGGSPNVTMAQDAILDRLDIFYRKNLRVILISAITGVKIRNCRIDGTVSGTDIRILGTVTGLEISTCEMGPTSGVLNEELTSVAGSRAYFNNLLHDAATIIIKGSGLVEVKGNTLEGFGQTIAVDANATGMECENNIIAVGQIIVPNSTIAALCKNNCMQGQALPGPNNFPVSNINTDPLFVNASGSVAVDFQLQGGSPCTDAGLDHSALYEDDFFGNPRPGGGIFDMGFWEVGVPKFGPTAVPGLFNQGVPSGDPKTGPESAPGCFVQGILAGNERLGEQSDPGVFFQGEAQGDPKFGQESDAGDFTIVFVEPVLKPGRKFKLIDMLPRINVSQDN